MDWKKWLMLNTRVKLAKIQHKPGRTVPFGHAKCWNDVRFVVDLTHCPKLHQFQNFLQYLSLLCWPSYRTARLRLPWKRKSKRETANHVRPTSAKTNFENRSILGFQSVYPNRRHHRCFNRIPMTLPDHLTKTPSLATLRNQNYPLIRNPKPLNRCAASQ